MRSYQAFTNEIDDLDLAVSKLKEQVDTFDLSPNTGGILYCGSEVDTSLLCKKLWNTFHLPFIGTTCIGQFTSQGYSEASICLNLFTGDDISFAGGMSCDLTSENIYNEIKETYYSLKKDLSQPENIIILYVPWIGGVVYDEIIDALSEASGGIPVFGGICSDEWEFDNCHAMFSGGSFTNRASMLLVGGSFSPKFAIAHSVIASTEKTVTVTKCEGSTVYELDDKPALDYLKSVGLDFEFENVFVDCLASPMLFTIKTPDGDSIKVLRNLFSVNPLDGSISFAGRVQQGAQMALALTSMHSIRDSLKKSCEELFAKMAEDTTNDYSGILVSSCTGRYSLTVADKNTECSKLLKAVENGLIVSGGYLNGEFCPTKGENTGKYYNLLNNETFAIMVF